MSITVSQMEGLLNRDMELMDAVWRKVAIKVPVLPTPALQWTRIGAGSDGILMRGREEGEEDTSLTFCMMDKRVAVLSGTEKSPQPFTCRKWSKLCLSLLAPVCV